MVDQPGIAVLPSVLAVHGLGGGVYELAPLIDAFWAEGLVVSAPTLPGHEGPGPVMPASSWGDWSTAVETAFDALAALGAPVMVVGFSTGATLALHLASRRPVAGLVLLAPFFSIRFSRLFLVPPALYLKPFARIFADLPRRPAAVGDPEVRRQLQSVSHFRTFNMAATLSALELIAEVKPLVPRIRTPTLILQGRRDTVIEPTGAAWLLRHLGSDRKQLLWFPRSDHLLVLDRDHEFVIAAAVAFVLGREVPP